MAGSKGVIATAVVVTAGSALVAHAVKKDAAPRTYARIVLAGFLMGAALTAVDEASAEVAQALAWLVTLSGLLINGQVLFNAASGSVGAGSGSGGYGVGKIVHKAVPLINLTPAQLKARAAQDAAHRKGERTN